MKTVAGILLVVWAVAVSAAHAGAPAGRGMTLAECQTQALLHSPDRRALDARLEAVRAWQRQAARWNPPDLDARVLSDELDLAVTQELDIWGKQASEARLAGARADEERAGYAGVQRELLEEVVRHFWALAGAEALLALTKEEATVRTALLNIRRGELALDALAEDALLEKRAELADQSILLRRVEFEVASARAQLNLLMGRKPDAALTLDAAASVTPLPATDVVLTQAMATAPGVLEARAKATAAGFRIEQERRQWLPNPEVGPALKREAQEWGVGVQLSFSIPVWDQNRDGIRAAEREKNAAQEQIASADRSALAAAWQALLAVRSLEDSLEEFERAILSLACERLVRAERGFADGTLSKREVLEIRLALLKRSREFERLRHDRHLATSRLALLQGTSPRVEPPVSLYQTGSYGR